MTGVLVVIPARGGSKRLPGKNLAKLAGRSLMEWTARVLLEAGLEADRCLLTTDDSAIADEGRRLGWLVPWLRPPELSHDTASSLETTLHALDWWRTAKGGDPGIVVLAQVTSPFRKPGSLRRAMAMLADDAGLDAVISAADLHRTPASLFAGSTRSLRSLGAASGGAVYTPNGSFYAIRSQALRREHTFFPARLGAVVCGPIECLDIDTHEDLQIAEAIAQSRESPTGAL